MKRCKSCLTQAETETRFCPVCGIDHEKKRSELNAFEKRIRSSARNIRFVSMLHLILAGICIMALPEFEQKGAIVAIAAINIVLALGLIQYAFWAYRLAVVCYFALGIVNIIAVNLLAIPLILLLLYAVGNKTAKAIFERRATEI